MRRERNPSHRGVLAWFVHNHVAANLLMLMVLIGGAMSMWQMRQEVFPEVDIGRITVRVAYPLATPEEVEEGVLLRVEEAVAGIDGVKRVRSVALEGVGTTIVEVEDYADTRQVLSDVQQAVERIDTFPQEIERPIVSEVTNQVQVLSVVLHGDVPERTLKNLAEQVRDDLTALGNISQISLQALRPFEISIDVSEQALRRWGLSFDQVADAVRRSSLDLPGGSVKTEGGQILLRTRGQLYTGREFEDIIVMSRPDGTTLRLSDLAAVHDGFADTDVAGYFDGRRAATLNVFAVGEQDALEVAATVKRYIESKRGQLPEGVDVETWWDRSQYLQSRIDLLQRNAMIGLVLVFACLALLLDLRLAFWTTLGIPISFMGAFWLLPYFDVTINMISLFAFIVVLGIVVDDAIVVGENIFRYREQGMSGPRAAILGVKEMAGPVTFAILTTVVAFMPLLFTSGEIGKMMRPIPIVVIAVLLFSLVEALLILPAHLARFRVGKTPGPLRRIQGAVQRGLEWVIRVPYVRSLEAALRWRYLTLAIAMGVLLMTVGFVAGGHIRWVFFPKIDADNVVVELTMPQGATVEQTRAVVTRLEHAAERVRRQLDAQRPPASPSVFKHINTTIGQQPFRALVAGDAQRGRSPLEAGESHLAEINLEMLPSDQRKIPSSEIAQLWREELGPVPGVQSLVFTSAFFSAGDAIHIELSHREFDKLLVAVDRLKAALATYEGVSDIRDSFEPGKLELKLSLTDQGRLLGLTLADLARQVRQGFYGEEVQRIQRGRDEVKVMVRYPPDERQSLADLQDMRIRLPDGTETAFRTVAEGSLERGYARIERTDRRRVVAVTADVDEALASSSRINQELLERVLPEIQQDFPALAFGTEGAQREQSESMRSLAMNFVVALLAIFALLGIQFRSYVQPVIVMSAIPFGLVGAVLGHVLLGLDLSFLSGFGIVAATGVVVNDSLIMIDLINRERRAGIPLHQVLLDSGTKRFRPILLTTLTTFSGLTPMLLETSLQARFLVPMAVSLAFGVLVATVVTLVLVPTLYLILEDARRHTRAIARLLSRTARAPVAAGNQP